MRPDQPETLGVHSGFIDYLYNDGPTGLYAKTLARKLARGVGSVANIAKGTGGDGEETGKKDSNIRVILHQVQVLMNAYPDYSLYVTGHSLGGALALIVALEAACLYGRRDWPVTWIGIGNPMVGCPS